jgi:hypothetical protein
MVRVIEIDKLTLRDMINDPAYSGLADGLSQLPVPESIRIKRKLLTIPQTVENFTANICYGQRLFLARKETNDFGIILRVMDGYYYSLATGKQWDEDKALSFGRYILTLKVKEIYPLAMYLVTLFGELIKKEFELLHREPSKMELAAGIEKLNVFSDLAALDFLRDAMKITVPEVLLTPYKECLVRFMQAKAFNEFQENYYKEMQEISKIKSKYVK